MLSPSKSPVQLRYLWALLTHVGSTKAPQSMAQGQGASAAGTGPSTGAAFGSSSMQQSRWSQLKGAASQYVVKPLKEVNPVLCQLPFWLVHIPER